MRKLLFYTILSGALLQVSSCKAKNTDQQNINIESESLNDIEQTQNKKNIILGADKISQITELTKDKNVGLIINHTSYLSDNKTFLLDTLVASGVKVKKLFSPEHGFRGESDAGETVKDGKDIKTGLPLISLYGKNKKPSEEHLSDIDILIFDIQDVGVRFYTYISTMHYSMESAAKFGKEFIVLDRPNPNDLVEGPVLENNCKSFVGTLPIPVLHGLTVGELANMIKNEGWIEGDIKLNVVKTENWKHGDPFSLSIKPSPNLPNDVSIRLYPSLCLFEGTEVSIGRGTYMPFQVIGYPDSVFGDFMFTPKSLPGFDKNPLQKDKTCYGVDLRNDTTTKGFDLTYFIDFYNKSKDKSKFISRKRFFDLLAGTEKLRHQIESGVTISEIESSWQPKLDKYKETRKKYLLY